MQPEIQTHLGKIRLWFSYNQSIFIPRTSSQDAGREPFRLFLLNPRRSAAILYNLIEWISTEVYNSDGILRVSVFLVVYKWSVRR